uniref:C2H2-type domain-containing protein n=1 Tax=Stomoxys calcitrans TaxID=35570 RepID=A0A1I8P8C2_STOCA
NPALGAKLLCAVCKDAFTNPWDLMVHAQAAHMVNIYELGSEPNNNSTSTANNNSNMANTTNNANNSLTMDEAIVTVGATPPSSSSLETSTASATNMTNNINEPNNINGLHCNISNDNDSNNNTKNHNGITMSREANCFTLSPDKMLSTSPLAASPCSVANVNGADFGVMATGASPHDNGCNGIVMPLELGQHTNDTEAHLELKFGICNSPIATINNKEENNSQRDEGSMDERMSDDIKLNNANGSVSSRGSTPTNMDHDSCDISQPQKRACIVRTLSIEASTTNRGGNSPTTSATLGLITNSLALSLNNSAAAAAAVASQAAAAIAPQ